MTKSVEIESIQKHINKISHIPEPLWEILKKHLEVEHFNKGVFLQKSKTPVTHGWLILQGIVRNHTLSIDGEEITMGIFSEGDITCAYPSFLKGEQSRDDIQTLEDSVCVSFRLDAILDLVNKHMELNTFLRRVTEAQLVWLYERSFNLLHLSASERLRIFKSTHSSIFDRLTQKQLSSYLGISREALNRIMKEG